ncbi:MAG: TIGR02611 family protein [Mycobacterium sp.]|nr:TIGR02611 family protein [Mycobacterium sp.]
MPEDARITARWRRHRERIRERPMLDFSYRVGVGVIGFGVLAVGIAAIPYPGPGWAIVFLGLAILASEFYWAHRTLSYTRRRYDTAIGWLRRQSWWVQALGALLTAGVVVMTLWLLGALAWSAKLVGLYHPALDSPLGLGA